MEYNADKLDIASLDSASVNNLQTLASNIGTGLGQIDFSHVPNVTGAKVGSCISCLSSVCGTHGTTPATQSTYNNLYNTVNLPYKSETEAQGLFGETGGSDLTGYALKSACSDALKKTMGERTNLDNYYIIKYFEDLEQRYFDAKAKYDEGTVYAMDTYTLGTLAYTTGYGDLSKEYAALQTEMKEAASRLDFERATELRDILFEMKAE